MVFKLFRVSGLPLALEEEELHALKTLEAQGRWTEYEELQDEYRNNDDLKELLIEADTVEELKLILTTIDSDNKFKIDFEHKLIEIQDQGRDH